MSLPPQARNVCRAGALVMGFNVGGVHHASVVVTDVTSSLSFYCNVLGLSVDQSRPDLGYDGAWLQVGMQQIHLLQVDNVDPTVGRPLHVGRDRHTALMVDNIDLLAKQLDESDIAYTRSRSRRRALFCRDPDGNGLEFVESKP